MQFFNLRSLPLFAAFSVSLCSNESVSQANVIVNNFNAQGFNGDGVGDSSNPIVDGDNGTIVTFTTRSLSDGGTLAASSAQLGYNRSTVNGAGLLDSGGFFDDNESWGVDADQDLSLLRVTFAAFSKSASADNADIIRMRSDGWVNLAGVTPTDSRVSFNSGAGELTFTADTPLNGSGDFFLFDMTGGAALPIFSGTDIIFTDASNNDHGWQLSRIEFSSQPLSSVPEPSSLTLLLLSCFVLISLKARKLSEPRH